MGVIRTEGFQRFQRMLAGPEGVNNYTDPAAILRPEFSERRSALENVGASVPVPALSATWANLNQGSRCAIVQDPISAGKNRLSRPSVPWIAPSGIASYGFGNSFNLPFASAKTHYVFGGLIRTVKNHTSALASANFNSGISIAALNAPLSGGNVYISAAWYPTAATKLFSINNESLGVDTSYTAAPVYSFSTLTDGDKLKPLLWDVDYYVEIEVDTVNNRYLVWIDDFLIRDSALPGPVAAFTQGLSIFFSDRYYGSAPANMPNIPFRYMISDMYVLDRSDSVAPTSRLGMTTRVAGFSPDTDVSVEFNRPSGFASNAAVVGGAIASQALPTAYLSGDAAGTTDIYDSSTKTVNSVAALVYAVSVKSRFMNGSAASHEVAAVLSDGATEVDSSYGAVAPASGLNARSVVFHQGPGGVPLTPAGVDELKFGFKIVS